MGQVNFSNKVISLSEFIVAAGTWYVSETNGVLTVRHLVGERILNPDINEDRIQMRQIAGSLFDIFDQTLRTVSFQHYQTHLLGIMRGNLS